MARASKMQTHTYDADKQGNSLVGSTRTLDVCMHNQLVDDSVNAQCLSEEEENIVSRKWKAEQKFFPMVTIQKLWLL